MLGFHGVYNGVYPLVDIARKSLFVMDWFGGYPEKKKT